MPIGTVALGSDGAGIFIGVSGGGRPVQAGPDRAVETGATSAVFLAGTLGSGKTIAAELIAYASERRGSRVVDFDPKPDHGFDRVPQLEGRVDVVELSGAEELPRGAGPAGDRLR